MNMHGSNGRMKNKMSMLRLHALYHLGLSCGEWMFLPDIKIISIGKMVIDPAQDQAANKGQGQD